MIKSIVISDGITDVTRVNGDEIEVNEAFGQYTGWLMYEDDVFKFRFEDGTLVETVDTSEEESEEESSEDESEKKPEEESSIEESSEEETEEEETSEAADGQENAAEDSGENSNVILLISMMLGVALVGVVTYKKKRNEF